jgi:hypothetical protein
MSPRITAPTPYHALASSPDRLRGACGQLLELPVLFLAFITANDEGGKQLPSMRVFAPLIAWLVLLSCGGLIGAIFASVQLYRRYRSTSSPSWSRQPAL